MSVTTLRGAKDQTVILRPGDHPFLRHESVVFYSGARIEAIAAVSSALDRDEARTCEPLDGRLLRLVLDGFRSSDQTPQKILRWLREHAPRADESR